MPKHPQEPDREELRRLAEEHLARRPASLQFTEPEQQRLLHELQVHQIELEMQNESLRQAQTEIQDALYRYTALNEELETKVAERTAELVSARDAAQAANRAKSAFLANMSHELRTPMHGILGMAELAQRHAQDPKLRGYLQRIDEASQHLMAVLNDILELSRIEAEQLTLEKIHFTLGSVLDKLDCLSADKAAAKGLAWDKEIPPELAKLSLLGDPLHFGQILLNLATNAVKFTAQGGVTLRASRIEESRGEILLRFAVQDTGIGISEEGQQRLFRPFEQLDSSMTRQYGGTGLGLAISKRLVQLMGGEIGVTSTPGGGSTFWFTVRLAKAADSAAPAQTVSGPSALE